jgi:hypothetical protein
MYLKQGKEEARPLWSKHFQYPVLHDGLRDVLHYDVDLQFVTAPWCVVMVSRKTNLELFAPMARWNSSWRRSSVKPRSPSNAPCSAGQGLKKTCSPANNGLSQQEKGSECSEKLCLKKEPF